MKAYTFQLLHQTISHPFSHLLHMLDLLRILWLSIAFSTLFMLDAHDRMKTHFMVSAATATRPTKCQTQCVFNFSLFDSFKTKATAFTFGECHSIPLTFLQADLHPFTNFAISTIIWNVSVGAQMPKEHVMYIRGKYSCYVSDSMLQPGTTICLTALFAHFDFLPFFSKFQ